MKYSKAIIILSFFSSLILGNMTIQQVKADPTNQASDNTTADLGETQPEKDTSSEPVINESQEKYPTAPVDNTQTQTVQINFIDQNSNQIRDEAENFYTINKEYSTGSTISPADISNQFNSELNGGYTINQNQSPITVEPGNNNYTFNVTAKTYPMTIYNYNPEPINTNSAQRENVDLTVGTVGHFKPDPSFNGFGFLTWGLGEYDRKNIPNSDYNDVLLTYDQIPNLQKVSSRYLLSALYATPLNQSIPIQRVDTEGKLITDDTSETLEGYKTFDDLRENVDLSNYINKKIPGFTYARTHKMDFKVSPTSIIKLMYTNDSLSYLHVNYRDTNTNSVIFTDYLLGNIGDIVQIRNVNTFNDLENASIYQFQNPNQATDYKIKATNEQITVDVEKMPLTLNLIQSIDNLKYTQSFSIPYGKTVDPSTKYLSNNINDIKTLYLKNPDEDVELPSYFYLRYEDVINLVNDITGTVTNMNSGQEYTCNINYDPSILNRAKRISIIYQTSNDATVAQKEVSISPENVETITKLIQDNTPSGYTLSNSNSIINFENDLLELAAVVTKNYKPSNNSHGSSQQKPDNNNESPSEIQKRISIYPDLSKVTIYDDTGKTTSTTIPVNSDWYTDQQQKINGQLFYRIATGKWLQESDIYVYDNKPTFVQTYSDSPKKLVNARNKVSTNRGLAQNSSWYSDRHTSLNGQKYYRVATDEWVNNDDVFEYQPIKKTVQPTKNAQLFNDKGSFVGMAPTYALLTDKLATINGTQMYRVATNEWLPLNYSK